MAGILLLPSRFTSQPQYLAPVVMDGRETQNLEASYLFSAGGLVDSMGNYSGSQSSATKRPALNGGIALDTSGSRSSAPASTRNYTATGSGKPLTVELMAYTLNADTTLDTALNLGGAGSGNTTKFTIHFNVFSGGGDIYVATVAQDFYTATGVLTLNAWNHIVVSYSGGIVSTTTLSIWVNGVLRATTKTGAQNNALNLFSAPVQVGYDSGGTRALRGYLAYARIWSRAMTEMEALQRRANLWSIYKAPSQIFPISDAAAASSFKPYWSSQRPRVYGAGVR